LQKISPLAKIRIWTSLHFVTGILPIDYWSVWWCLSFNLFNSFPKGWILLWGKRILSVTYCDNFTSWL